MGKFLCSAQRNQQLVEVARMLMLAAMLVWNTLRYTFVYIAITPDIALYFH